MHPLVNIALRAARDAAEAIAHGSDRLDRIKLIDTQPDSFLTSMDLDADKTILYHLEKAYPGHSINSRVSGKKSGEDGDTVWIIDPLLGNRNFAEGYPQFAVSIAIQSGGILKHAVIIHPLLGEEFVASRGQGAHLNSRRMRVSPVEELSESLIGVNSARVDQQNFLGMQQALLNSGASPRISGSSALDIVYTAMGRLQGGWSSVGETASVAAANLILQEAGGLIGSESGNPDINSGAEMIFGNPKMFKQLLKLRQSIG